MSNSTRSVGLELLIVNYFNYHHLIRSMIFVQCITTSRISVSPSGGLSEKKWGCKLSSIGGTIRRSSWRRKSPRFSERHHAFLSGTKPTGSGSNQVSPSNPARSTEARNLFGIWAPKEADEDDLQTIIEERIKRLKLKGVG